MSATTKGKLFISTRPLRDESVNGKSRPRRRSLTPSPSPRSRRGSRTDRNSFVSVWEDDGGIAQTFFDSKKPPVPSPLNQLAENAIVVDDPSPTHSATMATAMTLAPRPAGCCPCGRLDEWKAIRLRGRRMSRSTEDLRSRRLAAQLDGEAFDEALEQALLISSESVKVEPAVHPVGRSRLESLPVEVIGECRISSVSYANILRSEANG